MKPGPESESIPSPPLAEKRVGERIKLGSELAALGRLVGGVDLDIARDPTPTEPISFE